MELYDAIFYRKSIRSYSNRKIKLPLMEEVRDICSNITYLNGDLNIKAHVIDRGHLIHFLMGKNCKVKAPHYILVTSNQGEDYLQNIGFATEEIVLQLTTLGLATCWLESNLKREDILEFVELEDDELDEKCEDCEEDMKDEKEKNIENPYILIAFGYPEKSEELFKAIESQSDRESIKSISKRVDKRWNEVLEAVRLSPSIKNCQPWMFYNDKKGFHLYEKNQKKSIAGMSKISIGVSLRHFDIACKKYGIETEYIKVEAKKKVGKKYFISILEKAKNDMK